MAPLRAASTLVVVLAASPAGAVEPTVRYYEVTGTTFAELLASMRENGPFVERTGRRHYGITETSFRQSFRRQPALGRCELLEATVELDLTMVLPDWSDRNGATPATERRWERLEADIVAHEERHADIARRYLAKLRAEVDRPVTASTCAALDAGLRARSQVIIDRHREAQLEFDRSVNSPKLRNPRAG